MLASPAGANSVIPFLHKKSTKISIFIEVLAKCFQNLVFDHVAVMGVLSGIKERVRI
jgi:hypothetical protein